VGEVSLAVTSLIFEASLAILWYICEVFVDVVYFVGEVSLAKDTSPKHYTTSTNTSHICHRIAKDASNINDVTAK
jgi:hypothetical protein